MCLPPLHQTALGKNGIQIQTLEYELLDHSHQAQLQDKVSIYQSNLKRTDVYEDKREKRILSYSKSEGQCTMSF